MPAVDQPLSLNKEFHQLWATVVERHSNDASEVRAREQLPEQQKLLAQMISSERFVDPAVALMVLMVGMNKDSQREELSRYPLETAVETFKIVFNAAPAIARREAWAVRGDLMGAVDLKTFKQLAGQVVQEKLRAKLDAIDNKNQKAPKI